MKIRAIAFCVFVGLIGCQPVWLIVFTVILGGYLEEHTKTARMYLNKLDVPLAESGGHDATSLMANMKAFQDGFHELKVSDTHRGVLDKVMHIAIKAQALQLQMDTISGTEYQAELSRLRDDVALLPPIGMQAFEENHPWISRMLTYAWEKCVLSLSLGFGISVVVFCVFYGFARADLGGMRADSTDSAESNRLRTSSGGGGGYGHYGGGIFGEGPPPEVWIRNYPKHPNQGFPPWSSM